MWCVCTCCFYGICGLFLTPFGLCCFAFFFFFQAEDGIRDLVRSRGLGDVYKRQSFGGAPNTQVSAVSLAHPGTLPRLNIKAVEYAVRLGLALGCGINRRSTCLLYTSDAADERTSVDLGGRRYITKKKNKKTHTTDYLPRHPSTH